MRDEVLKERAAVVAEIYGAFAGVSREGGISWAGAELCDGGQGWPDLLAEAAANERDTCWEELVDDPNWNPSPGGGGFCFLDEIGRAYDLPPALIRIASAAERSGLDESMQSCLAMPMAAKICGNLNERQLRSIAKF